MAKLSPGGAPFYRFPERWTRNLDQSAAGEDIYRTAERWTRDLADRGRPALGPACRVRGAPSSWRMGAQPARAGAGPNSRPGCVAAGRPVIQLTPGCRLGRGGAGHTRGRRAGRRLQARRGAERCRDGAVRQEYDRALIRITQPPEPISARAIPVCVGNRPPRHDPGETRSDSGGADIGITPPRCLTLPRRLTARQTARLGRTDTAGAAGQPRQARTVTIGHININRLMPSLDEVNIMLNEHNFGVLCVGETFLTDQVDDRYLLFPGYVVTRRDRVSNGGGVCIIRRDDLQAEVMTVPSTGSPLETLWMLVGGNSPMIIGVVYRPPKSPIASTLDDLHHQLTYVLTKGRAIYVLGDINIDLLRPSSPEARRYIEMLHDLSLEQVITEATRTCETMQH